MKIIEKVIRYPALTSWTCIYESGEKDEIDPDLARILIENNECNKSTLGLINTVYTFIQPAKIR